MALVETSTAASIEFTLPNVALVPLCKVELLSDYKNMLRHIGNRNYDRTR